MSDTDTTKRLIAPKGKQASLATYETGEPVFAPTAHGQTRLSEFARD